MPFRHRTMPRPWVVVQHVPFEGPGLIAAVAGARAIRLDVRHMERGDPLPDVADVGGLIVMGGPMGAGDTAVHPHLAREQELLRAAVERDLPVLGVCLGAQLLAAALGARVTKGASPEVGLGQVTLTAEGRKDRVLGAAGDTIPVFHWHEDTFEVPRGAVHLARSDLFPNQAFRAGKRAYAFQFHVEVDRALATEWATRLPASVRIDENRRAAVELSGGVILARFFDEALAL